MTTAAPREDRLAGAPVLVAEPASAGAGGHAGTGCVLVYHGLCGHKGQLAEGLARIAAQGLRAVGVDAIGHGARGWPDLDARLAGSEEGSEAAFLEVLRATVGELPALSQALVAAGLAGPGRLGIAGVSLGGFVAYGAVVRGLVAAAASIVGSPRWATSGAAEDAPERFPERFFPAALLTVTAGRDATVPPGPARALHAALLPRYAAAPERLARLDWPEAGHELGPSEWEATWSEVAVFMARHLCNRQP